MSLARVTATVVGVVLGYVISAVSFVDLGKFFIQAVVTGSVRWSALPRGILLFLSGMAFAVVAALLFR